MVAQNLNRSTVNADDFVASVKVDDRTFLMWPHNGGWYVGTYAGVEFFYSGRVAAGHFRQLVETAQLEHEARRIDDLAMARFRANHPVGSEWRVDSIEYNAAMGY